MRINLHTDFALRVLIYLACRPGTRITTEVIAESHGVSLHHLQKVVRSLKESGFVALYRGPSGGVELAQAPADISVGAVVRALDDSSGLVECFRPEESACVLAPACDLKGALGQAQEAFYASLDPLTLGALVSGRRSSRLRKLTDSA